MMLVAILAVTLAAAADSDSEPESGSSNEEGPTSHDPE
jgi:hypothetical protein